MVAGRPAETRWSFTRGVRPTVPRTFSYIGIGVENEIKWAKPQASGNGLKEGDFCLPRGGIRNPAATLLREGFYFAIRRRYKSAIRWAWTGREAWEATRE
jgi:hypothetical protein